MRLASWAVAVVFIAGSALAQSFADLNRQALEAYSAGDLDKALRLTRDVTEAGPERGRDQPEDYLQALNNLTFLRFAEGGTGFADEALAFADATRQIGTDAGLTAIFNAAQAHAQAGNRTRSTALRNRLLDVARGTSAHGVMVALAVDLAFLNDDVAALPRLIEEMIDVTGGYSATTTLDQLYARQEELEQTGDVEGVSALIDARILLVGAIAPDLRDDFAHAPLSQKFNMNYQAENFHAAADAFRDWTATGMLSEEESEFIAGEARNGLLLAQMGTYADEPKTQLSYAELVLAFAELAYDPDDPRIGLTLREVADAQARLGQYENAAETLQDAVLNLNRTSEGKVSLHLVLEDLATNAWQRGDLEQSARLFARADKAYESALRAGAEPLSDMDRSILSLNLSRLEVERGRLEEARAHLRQARVSFESFVGSGTAKPPEMRHEVQIAQAEALLAAESGAEEATEAALALVRTADKRFPPRHPSRALTLANAADQLYAVGRADLGRPLLLDAQSIAREALPANAPLSIQISVKLGLDAVARGNMTEAITQFRKVVAARQSPENRAQLADAYSDFAFLAWALLSKADVTPDDIDEALAALQWTQTGQSAEAYAMMAQRMSLQDPEISALIKRRQDAVAAMEMNRTALTRALADGQNPADILQRQRRLREDLQSAETAMAGAGAPLIGQGAIAPLDLKGIQSRLGAQEVLVTFLLPSLAPEAVEGLDTSSNLAIAIRTDAIAIAPISEISRRRLNEKIDAFRCEMAISDPNCALAGSGRLRGAMTLDAPPSESFGFDWDIAHAVYSDLFGSIEDMLRENDHLIIVPPGDLLRLPFQALVTRPQIEPDLASADWLVRHHAVSVLPSIAAFQALKAGQASETREPRFLGVGDPVIGSGPDLDCASHALATLRSAGDPGDGLYAESWIEGVRVADVRRLRQMTRLPDATCELQAIRSSLGDTRSLLLTRDRATETELKRLSASGALNDFDLLVFATHGIVAGETSAIAPGLVMTPPATAGLHDDGLLTAAEVAGLSMSARLVILSACNTAAGKDAGEEGLSGLASGFFHAGARSLMVTHWAVFSDASAHVSARLAAKVAQESDRSIADALREITLDILDNPNGTARERHPAYWAPFSIIGL